MTNKEVQNDKKDRTPYGTKIPIIGFEEAIKIIEETGEQAGQTGSLDALSKIMGNSLSSSVFHTKIAFLKNLGLVTAEKQEYAFTEIGDKIVTPHSPEEKQEAIFEAFKNLDILKKVWENYRGKILPQTQFLANYLETTLKIPTTLKKKWAEYFEQAGLFAKILDQREGGSFQVLLQPFSTGKKDVKKNEETKSKDTENIPPPKDKDELGIDQGVWGILSKKILSGNRKAIFAIPEQLTQQDIDALRVFLKGIEVQLDGLKRLEE